LPWQQNVKQIAYNSSCIRDISDIFASNEGFLESSYTVMSVKF